jgi:hypothetical protein
MSIPKRLMEIDYLPKVLYIANDHRMLLEGSSQGYAF